MGSAFFVGNCLGKGFFLKESGKKNLDGSGGQVIRKMVSGESF